MMNSPHLFFESYKKSVYDKNVEAFVSLYDEDIHVFDMWSSWQMKGLVAWRDMAQGWFGSLGDERVVVSFYETQVQESGDMAWVSAFVKFAAQDASGNELRSLDNRLSAVLKKKEERWLVVHEHTSAPIDHATLKASLRRA